MASLLVMAVLLLVIYSPISAANVPAVKTMQVCPTITLTGNYISGPAGDSASIFVTASPAGNYQYSVVSMSGPTFVEGNYSLNPTTGELKVFRIKWAPYYDEGSITVQATDANGCYGVGEYTPYADCPAISITKTEVTEMYHREAYSGQITINPPGNYRWSFSNTREDGFGSGALPAGLTLDTLTGKISGEPLSGNTVGFVGDYTIQVTNEDLCTAKKTFFYNVQLAHFDSIPFPDSVPNGRVGQAYSAAINAGNDYSRSLNGYTSADLPPGLIVDWSDGIITGIPTQTGTYHSTIVIDGDYYYGTLKYTFVIEASDCPTTAITFPASIPSAVVGQDYRASVAVSPSGKYTYSFSPAVEYNFSIDAQTGVISGRLNFEANIPLTVVVTDTNGCSANKSYVLRVEPACPTITFPPSLPSGTVGQDYSALVAVSPAGNYTYSFASENEFPISIDPQTGVISTYWEFRVTLSFVVRATAANGCYADKAYTLHINCPELTAIPPKNGRVGEPYKGQLTTNLEYYVSISETAEHKFPDGLYNGENGYIFGMPTKAGIYTLHYYANEPMNGCDFAGTFTLVIEPATAPVCQASGSIFQEVWLKAPGYDVRQIPVTTPVQSSRQLTKFEGWSNLTNNYGDRISGYICPPTSGNYTFWIASDDNGALLLSSDEQPTKKQRIAWVNGATKPREWTKYTSQQSMPIYLEAGKKYYIESLHKEAYGADHIAVGWQLPNGTLERPIPGKRLSPFIAPANARTIESQKEVAQEFAAIASLSAAPNPFSDQTTIRFSTQAGKATVAVYDLSGSLMQVLFEGELEEGQTKELTLEGALLPSGIYLVKATSPTNVSHIKVVLAK